MNIYIVNNKNIQFCCSCSNSQPTNKEYLIVFRAKMYMSFDCLQKVVQF